MRDERTLLCLIEVESNSLFWYMCTFLRFHSHFSTRPIHREREQSHGETRNEGIDVIDPRLTNDHTMVISPVDNGIIIRYRIFDQFEPR